MDPDALASLRANTFPVILSIYGIPSGSPQAIELRNLLGGGCEGPPFFSSPESPARVLSLLPGPMQEGERGEGGVGTVPLPNLRSTPYRNHNPVVEHIQRRAPSIPRSSRHPRSTFLTLPNDAWEEVFSFLQTGLFWIYEWYLVNKRFARHTKASLTQYRDWLRGILDIEQHMMNAAMNSVSAAPHFLLLTPRKYNLSIALMVCGACGYSGPLEASGREGTRQSYCIRCQDLRACELQKLLWTAK